MSNLLPTAPPRHGSADVVRGAKQVVHSADVAVDNDVAQRVAELIEKEVFTSLWGGKAHMEALQLIKNKSKNK